MLFTKLIKKIVTGVLLTTFIVGHMGEICVYAAEGDGSLSGNAAEEALLENSIDEEEGLSDDQVVTGDETISEDNAGSEKASDSENAAVSEDDTVLEENRNVYEVLDLGFGKCRMCVCGPESAKELLRHHERIRVASKYPNIAKDYFYNKKHQTVDIIKLNGSVELGPLVSLSDVIVDIVETGSTLKENGLQVLEEVCPLSARMIVNPVSMQMEKARIRDVVLRIREYLDSEKA